MYLLYSPDKLSGSQPDDWSGPFSILRMVSKHIARCLSPILMSWKVMMQEYAGKNHDACIIYTLKILNRCHRWRFHSLGLFPATFHYHLITLPVTSTYCWFQSSISSENTSEKHTAGLISYLNLGYGFLHVGKRLTQGIGNADCVLVLEDPRVLFRFLRLLIRRLRRRSTSFSGQSMPSLKA